MSPSSAPATGEERAPAPAEQLAARLAFGGAAACIAIVARLQPLRSADLLWQLRTGERVLAHGRVREDLFSFPFRGAPIHDHESAFEALVALLGRGGDFTRLWWLNLALVVGAVLFAAYAAERIVRDRLAVAVATAVVVVAASPRLELRAEAATFAAIACAHAIRRRVPAEIEPGRALGRWPLVAQLAPIAIAALAAPFHGLALLVVLVPTAHVGEVALEIARGRASRAAKSRALLDVGVAVATVAVVEALAPGLLANIFASASGPTFMRHILEWYSPWRYVQTSGDVTPLVAIGCSLAAIGGLHRLANAGRARRSDVLLLCVLTFLALRFVRFTATSILAAMPWVVAGLASLLGAGARRIRPLRARVAVAGVAWALALAHVATQAQLHGVVGFDWGRQPRAAVAWLRARAPNAALFHGYNQGALLIFEGFPPRGVVIDSRAWTLYPEPYARRYYEAMSDPARFEAWAAEAPFDSVLLARNHTGSKKLASYLATSAQWTLAFEDPQAVVFLRRARAPESAGGRE